MKQQNLIVLGLAGVALYMIVKTPAGKKALQSVTGTASNGLRDMSQTVTEVLDNTGKAFSNGWRYFNDGTAIDPAGNYYQGGQLIWSNPAQVSYA